MKRRVFKLFSSSKVTTCRIVISAPGEATMNTPGYVIENWGIMNECDRQQRKAFTSSWKDVLDLSGEMLTVVTD